MKQYPGIKMKEGTRPPKRPVVSTVTTANASSIIRDAAKRVIKTHAEVIKALAKR